jgi:glycosyltransferase involved in cell wall biosynthesis
MSFSILIPTLNEEKYIGTLLGALTKQTYKDFEVIVVDGNSKDNTQDVVREYLDKLNLRLLKSPKRGVSFQRNYAVSHARHEDLMFMDADICVEENFLADIAAYLEKNAVDVLTAKNIPMSNLLFDRLLYGGFHLFMRFMSLREPILIGTFFYVKKSVFDSVSGFSEDLFISEDMDLARRIYSAGFKKYVLLESPKVFFSVRRLNETGRLAFIHLCVRAGYHYYFKGGVRIKDAHKFFFPWGQHK